MRTFSTSEKLYFQMFISALLFGIVFAGGYAGYATYRNEKVTTAEKIAMLESKTAGQEYAISELTQELVALRGESGELKADLSSVANRQKKSEEKGEAEFLSARQKLQSLESDIAKNAVPEIATIISEWRPYLASIRCDFKYVNTGGLYYQTRGSGTLLSLSALGGPVVLSNNHIVSDPDGYKASYCEATLPDRPLSFTVAGSAITRPQNGGDFSSFALSGASGDIINLAKKNPKLCTGKPALGDEIVILGYPSIGSQSNITATEGIISGYDGDYFITSAKVEQGNSGGAAILTKENCFLGIPTFVALGKVESLARILDVAVVVGSR